MDYFSYKTRWKLLLLIVAVAIGFFSLLYTNSLVKSLKNEERRKVELWAEATRQLINETDSSLNLPFLYSIIEDNGTVPVILTDGNDSIISHKNFGNKSSDIAYINGRLKKMMEKENPIIIEFTDGYTQKIYYRDSTILSRLVWYPYVQLGIIILFITVAYLAFSSSRKAEQNQVWLGMSKETAHQLGTPVSSLAGWVEILRIKLPESDLPSELARDVARLEKVTERFSKIGSKPELKPDSVFDIVNNTIDYLRSRTSSKVKYSVANNSDVQKVPVNSALFSWVIENICKNAVDATGGEGEIRVEISRIRDYVITDIRDTGRGIPGKSFSKIFKPGYTTKKHGWGLGLSLSKRIIEEYHHGKLFVKYSEPGKGTCIRIMMPFSS